MEKQEPLNELAIMLSKVQALVENEEYSMAIALLSLIIGSYSPNDVNLAFLFSYRSSLYSMMHKWESAISDMKRSIALSPHDYRNYISLGAYITFKYFYSGEYRIDNSNDAIIESIECYKESIRLEPTHPTSYLNLIETYLFIMDWENALCYLGMCKPYLLSKENKLIWSWLTCLTLSLDGEAVEPEDIDILLNSSEDYVTNHDFRQIDSTLDELDRINFFPDRLRKAREIHTLYKKRIGALS